MSSLLFITNELMNPSLQKQMHLPLEFIQFGITDGKMYRHYRSKSTFTISQEINKPWGNNKVYGALFSCKDFDYYSHILDAYHICSLSTMLKNNTLDTHHRIWCKVTPIYFNTIDQLARLKYREGESIAAQMYLGNVKHPRIKQRTTRASYRITDGIDVFNFLELFKEVDEYR